MSGNTPQKVEKFKYHGVVFIRDARRIKEIELRIGEANAVLRKLHRSAVTKRELSNTRKLSVLE